MVKELLGYVAGRWLCLSLIAFIILGCSAEKQASPIQEIPEVVTADLSRPNFVIIMADDLGFAELGVYGSEISTPNIDSIASAGVQFSSFYTSPNCSPTRAMLLTGADSHLVGLGAMANILTAENQRGLPGYEGYLNERALTFTELLDDAGYRNYMAGKWHLGKGKGQLPDSKGFDRYFAQLSGTPFSHFNFETGYPNAPPNYVEDGQAVLDAPQGYFSSDFYTEKLIEFLDAERDSNQPFLAYLAFTANHYPLQVPDEYIEQQRGRYDQGYEQIRHARYRRQKEMGLITDSVGLAVSPPTMTSWDDLSEEDREIQSRIMEVYAGMTVNMDDNVGRLLEYLKESGQYENTHILFLSDNGPGGLSVPVEMPGKMSDYDNSLKNLGKPGSYYWPGPGWASAGASPFRLFKRQVAEGGIRVPAIWKFAGGNSTRNDAVVNKHIFTVRDVAPTILELANVDQVQSPYKGRDIVSISGQSMAALVDDPAALVHSESEAFGVELFARRALRAGDWKLLRLDSPFGNDNWQLYNLEEDPIESQDLSEQYPEKLSEMLSLWEEYKVNNNVVIGDPAIIP